MSEQDRYDKQAKELLPCVWVCYANPMQDHNPSCPGHYRPAVAAALRALAAERDDWKNQTERVWREVNGLRPERDDDGACLRCGLGWDDEKDNNDEHQCPPGFWNENEKKISQLKAQLGEAIQRLDKHHVCGYTTGNQSEPCPTCEYIKAMADLEAQNERAG